ncbi:MAG: FAD-binding protein [Alphaproteobacteria bacterium]|nr:FAD-binding protein [Alphaproteobacteria bacterium]
MPDIRRVLVIGGGVGGLTAAAFFARRGVETVLIERRPAFDIPGIGLGQPANALRIYDKLGVLDEILATGFSYDRMFILDAQRRLIVDHKFLMGDERVPPFCALSRLELHEILLGAAQRAGADIRLGVTADAFHDDGDRVDVAFSNGMRDAFDLVAGFDGIRSTTRLHLVGTAFAPRYSGYGAWRVQAARPDEVRRMEFMQGVGCKTGAMPLSNNVMYLFHIRPEAPDANFDGQDRASLFRERLKQFGGFVADIAASLNSESDIVYSPIEPMLLPWPWFRGRVAIGGDAAHVVAPHLTQGAAMAAEDAYVLVRETLGGEGPIEDRLMRYSRLRYPRCAFVYSFSGQWLHDEQSVRTPHDMEAARGELMQNGSARIGASDRVLDERV